MTSLSLSRWVFAIAVTVGSGSVPFTIAWAQATDIAPYDSGDQTDQDLSQLDMQNVAPARQQLLMAMQQLQADQQSGNAQAVLTDQLAVIDVRQSVIDAQIVADQTRMAQAPADVQAMLQARDQVLQTEQALGEAQKRLIRDRQTNDTGSMRDDVARINSARASQRRAHQQWIQVRAQIHNELSPIEVQ